MSNHSTNEALINQIVNWTDRQEKEMVKFLVRLVNINSKTENRDGVNAVAEVCLEVLSDIPLEFERFTKEQAGDLVIARSRSKPDKPKLLLAGHLDTVHPLQTYKGCVIEGDWCIGPGANDMKGGVTVIIYTLLALSAAESLVNLILVLIPDEETGSQTYADILAEVYKSADYAMVYEPAGKQEKYPTDLSYREVVVARKGVGRFTLRVHGRKGHSGTLDHPQERCNAISELASKITRLDALADYQKGTTVNVGVVNGGTAFNVIPGSAELEFDVRFRTQDEAKRVLSEIKTVVESSEIPGTSAELETVLMVPPMEENSSELIEVIREQGHKLGIRVETQTRSGGSDANHISQHGPQVVDGFGPYGSGSHTEEERVYLPSLVTTTQLSALTISRLLAD